MKEWSQLVIFPSKTWTKILGDFMPFNIFPSERRPNESFIRLLEHSFESLNEAVFFSDYVSSINDFTVLGNCDDRNNSLTLKVWWWGKRVSRIVQNCVTSFVDNDLDQDLKFDWWSGERLLASYQKILLGFKQYTKIIISLL